MGRATDGGLPGIFRERVREGAHWQRVESPTTGLGIPDSNVCIRGIDTWVEFKKTGGWTAGLRPEQVAWHTRRTQVGGRTLIAVRRTVPSGPRRGDACDELWMFWGDHARVLHTGGLRGGAPACHMSEGGPSRWDWGHVRSLLESER